MVLPRKVQFVSAMDTEIFAFPPLSCWTPAGLYLHITVGGMAFHKELTETAVSARGSFLFSALQPTPTGKAREKSDVMLLSVADKCSVIQQSFINIIRKPHMCVKFKTRYWKQANIFPINPTQSSLISIYKLD